MYKLHGKHFKMLISRYLSGPVGSYIDVASFQGRSPLREVSQEGLTCQCFQSKTNHSLKFKQTCVRKTVQALCRSVPQAVLLTGDFVTWDYGLHVQLSCYSRCPKAIQ